METGVETTQYKEKGVQSIFSQEFCRRLETVSMSSSHLCVCVIFQSAGKFFGRVDAPVMQQLIRSDENSTTGVYNK